MVLLHHFFFLFFFFFNDTATTEIYTLSLHDALPISRLASQTAAVMCWVGSGMTTFPFHRSSRRSTSVLGASLAGDRKSTRLNSSHGYISYAVFCLKKKKKKKKT